MNKLVVNQSFWGKSFSIKLDQHQRNWSIDRLSRILKQQFEEHKIKKMIYCPSQVVFILDGGMEITVPNRSKIFQKLGFSFHQTEKGLVFHNLNFSKSFHLIKQPFPFSSLNFKPIFLMLFAAVTVSAAIPALPLLDVGYCPKIVSPAGPTFEGAIVPKKISPLPLVREPVNRKAETPTEVIHQMVQTEYQIPVFYSYITEMANIYQVNPSEIAPLMEKSVNETAVHYTDIKLAIGYNFTDSYYQNNPGSLITLDSRSWNDKVLLLLKTLKRYQVNDLELIITALAMQELESGHGESFASVHLNNDMGCRTQDGEELFPFTTREFGTDYAVRIILVAISDLELAKVYDTEKPIIANIQPRYNELDGSYYTGLILAQCADVCTRYGFSYTDIFEKYDTKKYLHEDHKPLV